MLSWFRCPDSELGVRSVACSSSITEASDELSSRPHAGLEQEYRMIEYGHWLAATLIENPAQEALESFLENEQKRSASDRATTSIGPFRRTESRWHQRNNSQSGQKDRERSRQPGQRQHAIFQTTASSSTVYAEFNDSRPTSYAAVNFQSHRTHECVCVSSFLDDRITDQEAEKSERTFANRCSHQCFFRWATKSKAGGPLIRSKRIEEAQHCGENKMATALDGTADSQSQVRGSQESKECEAGSSKNKGSRTVNVADRVRALEHNKGYHELTRSSKAARRHEALDRFASVDGRTSPTRPGNEDGAVGVPLIFPLHVKKFHRRISKGGLVPRVETPLYRSEPANEPFFHAPTPLRKKSSLVSDSPEMTPLIQNGEDSAEINAQQQQRPRGEKSPELAKDTNWIQQQPAPGTAVPSPSKNHLFSPKPRVNPVAHFHGTRGSCVRHGRKSGPNHKHSSRNFKATRDMVEISRNGALIPVGFTTRTNLEATSPYRYLTKPAESKTTGDEACPDCLHELEIRKREMELSSLNLAATAVAQSSRELNNATVQSIRSASEHKLPILGNPTTAPLKRISSVLVPPETANSTPLVFLECRYAEPVAAKSPAQSWGSTKAKDSTSSVQSWDCRDVNMPRSGVRSSGQLDPPTRTSSAARSVSGAQMICRDVPTTPFGQRTKAVDFQSAFGCDSNTEPLVVARDLGEGLDAMILEYGGQLERVITNSRRGNPTAEMMLQLSRELISVSTALAYAQTNDLVAIDGQDSLEAATRTRMMVVDRSADANGLRQVSVPELLDLMANASREFEPGHTQRTRLRGWPQDMRSDQIPCQSSATERQFRQPFDNELDLKDERDMETGYRELQEYFGLLGRPASQILDNDACHPNSLSTAALSRTSTTSRAQPSASRPDSNLSSTPRAVPAIPNPTVSQPTPLPSQVLRAADFAPCLSLSAPNPPRTRRQPSLSPLLFTDSTLPSLRNSAQEYPSPQPSQNRSANLPSRSSPSAQMLLHPPPTQDLGPTPRDASSQVIRHVMRMEKNWAVREAAAAERQARRKRGLVGEVRRAIIG